MCWASFLRLTTVRARAVEQHRGRLVGSFWARSSSQRSWWVATGSGLDRGAQQLFQPRPPCPQLMMEQSKKSSLMVARSILNNKLISNKLERYLKVSWGAPGSRPPAACRLPASRPA